MSQEPSALEVDLLLRRARSTGDLGFESPAARASRHHHGRTDTITTQDRPQPLRGSSLNLQPDVPALATPQPALTRDLAARDRSASTNQAHLPPIEAELRALQSRRRRPSRPVPNGVRGKFLVFFGLAGPDAKARSELINVIWKMGWGFVQFVVIIALLVVSSKRASPTMAGKTQWNACHKPLGAWNAVWLARVTLGSILWYWEWRRQLATRRIEQEEDSAAVNAEAGRTTRQNTNATIPATQRQDTQGTRQTRIEAQLPNNHLFRRLNVTTNLLSLVWFLTAHVLAYSTINTCRHSTPILWWLMFGVLCVLYLMLLEIFLIGLLIFILGPVIYLIYNVALLCLGRHPLQHPHDLHAEIKKIPKSVVDQIPLVLYIPTPPEEGDDTTKSGAASPITVPAVAHSYPPKTGKKPTARKRRFAFFRRSKKANVGSKVDATGDASQEDSTWEDNWVPGDYPFVRLAGNRAACAICLMDFDEPERAGKAKEAEANGEVDDEKLEESGVTPPASPDEPSAAPVQEVQVQVEEMTIADAVRLQLEDAGEGAQPLRLLACGHAFHKTCVDPWLTDVSGRCPVCQRPIVMPDDSKKKRRGRRTQPPSPSSS